MSRRTRLFIPGIPNHVCQRGNNKMPIFFSERDYVLFLNILKEAKSKHPCFIYSYCLMPNHFHLLIEPETRESISLFMKFLGAKYVHYVNKIHERTGTLWEGRFRCSMVDRESYFISCLRYIEMNPVRAGIVESPVLYRWSSYRVMAFAEENKLLDLDKWYNHLGENIKERKSNFRRLFQDYIMPRETLSLIRAMVNKGGLTGGDKFKEQVEGIIGKKLVFHPQGRPFKTVN